MSFVSFLKKVGQDFEKGLSYLLPIAETAGEAAMTIFLPGLSPIFNTTVATVVTAEQKYAALKQENMGAQKLVDVTNMIGPLVEQALKDAGKPSDASSVQNYINAVVTILNTLPAGSLTNQALTPPTVPALPAPAVPTTGA